MWIRSHNFLQMHDSPDGQSFFPPHSFSSMYLWEVASFPGWRAPSMWQILRVMVGWTESESTVCVRRRGCLTWVWRHLSRGSLCRSCVPSDRRCCSSPVPQWWRKLCRKLSAGHPSGFLCCCQTGYDTDSSAASEQLGPDQRDHISDISWQESFQRWYKAWEFKW